MCFDAEVRIGLRARGIVVAVAVLVGGTSDVVAQPNQGADVATVLGRGPQGPAPFERLATRIEAVANEPGATAAARDPIAHARRALARARELLRLGDRTAAARAEQIGWAAIELATRRVGRARALEVARDAAQRAERAEARARAAREALDTVIAERARLTAGDAQPAAGENETATEATE